MITPFRGYDKSDVNIILLLDCGHRPVEKNAQETQMSTRVTEATPLNKCEEIRRLLAVYTAHNKF